MNNEDLIDDWDEADFEIFKQWDEEQKNKKLEEYESFFRSDMEVRKMLIDRIKKLQEKNNELLTLYTTERNVKEDYKAIINKAIEYIENTDEFDIEIFDCNTGGCLGTDLSIQAKELLNILQGSDKE